MSVLRSQLDAAVALFAEIVTSPAFPVREVERLKSERLAEILQLRAEPRGLADEIYGQALYAKGSRYARPERGSAGSVAQLSPTDPALPRSGRAYREP